ncbi:MAG TPA: hypothetical protein VGJ60_15755 [Chloroflexota bacterium]|jgi:hypothetical protein
MSLADIPLFHEARRGQILRSDDWNTVQRELRNSVRSHRHARPPGDPGEDASSDDDARQISTEEIADGAVTADKLSPDLRGSIPVDRDRPQGSVPSGQAGVVPEQVHGSVMLAAGARVRIEHGLGRVPVCVVLGVRQTVKGLRGTFDVYGPGAPVIAAVPRNPDGSFVVLSSSDAAVTVTWWAFTSREER